MNYLRKKLQAIMACADFKGYLREVTGTDSVTLTDCMGSDLVSLSVTGNAVQDGTPSPETPVEIQGCGDRTANLFDVLKMTSPDIQTDKNKVTLTKYASSTGINISSFISMTGLKPGDTITTRLRIRVVSGAATSLTGRMSILGAGNVEKGALILVDRCLSGEVVQTVQIPDNFNTDNYGGLYVYGSSSGGVIEFSNIQIVEGSYTAETMPPYEPYGYKIPVEVSGRNLLDYTKATDRFGTPLTIINNGVSWDSHVSYYFFIPCDLKSGMTVRFSCKSDYPENSDIISSFMVHYVDGSTDYQTIDYSITLKNDVDRIQIRKRNASIKSETPIKVTDIMLVQGSYTADTMPPYEPYHAPQTFNVYMDKPLYATGDVGDEITLDFEHKTATRTDKTMLSEFNENAAWKYNGTAIGTYSCTFLISVTPAREYHSAVMCNRFKKINTTSLSSADEESGVYEGAAINYIINHNLIGVTAGMTTTESIALWKSWLSGNNVKTLYQLLTPATTDISAMQDWDTIPKLWRGTAIATVKTTVPTKAITARYYATKKED